MPERSTHHCPPPSGSLQLATVSPDERVYLGEIRKREKYRHAQDGRWAKTLLRYDVCDWLGKERARAMPYWDRFDEGLFVGGRFAGSPLHVDQILWSNVGKNFTGARCMRYTRYTRYTCCTRYARYVTLVTRDTHVQLDRLFNGCIATASTPRLRESVTRVTAVARRQRGLTRMWDGSHSGRTDPISRRASLSVPGHKLLAIWEYGEPSRKMFDEFNYTLFEPPLNASEAAAAGSALKVLALHALHTSHASHVSHALHMGRALKAPPLRPSTTTRHHSCGSDDALVIANSLCVDGDPLRQLTPHVARALLRLMPHVALSRRYSGRATSWSSA